MAAVPIDSAADVRTMAARECVRKLAIDPVAQLEI
jgi:hypothetical protein